MSLDGWKRASFLVGSESDVRQWEPLPGGSVRPSGPCCFAVARAPFVSLDGWKRASFLGGRCPEARSVPQGPPCRFAVARAPFVQPWDGWKRAFSCPVQKATLGSPVARRLGPSFRALLFCCGEGAVCEP